MTRNSQELTQKLSESDHICLIVSRHSEALISGMRLHSAASYSVRKKKCDDRMRASKQIAKDLRLELKEMSDSMRSKDDSMKELRKEMEDVRKKGKEYEGSAMALSLMVLRVMICFGCLERESNQ